MADGIKTVLMADAKEFIGKNVAMHVIEGDVDLECRAHVDHVAHISHSGPCLITDHGDDRLDHLPECRAAQ